MTRQIILFIIAAFLALGYAAVKAQGDFRKGFIVKNDLDTIRGFVDYRWKFSNERVCHFKEELKSRKIKFTPSEIRSYGITGVHTYVSIRLKDYSAPRFIQEIVNGKIELLFSDRSYYIKTDSILLKIPKPNRKEIVYVEGNGNFQKIDKRYVKFLDSLFKDCAITAKDTEYNEAHLGSIVRKYNVCKGNTAPQITKSGKPFIKVGFHAAYGIGKFSVGGIDRYGARGYIDSYRTFGYNQKLSTFGGAGIDFYFPRISNNLSFELDLFIQDIAYLVYRQADAREEFDITTSAVKVPIAVCFNFLPGNNTPYVKAGLVNYTFNSTSTRVLIETQFGNIITLKSDDLTDSFSGSSNNFWFGIGYKHNLINKLKVFGEFRFEKLNNFMFQNSSFSSVNFLLGIKF